MLEQTGTPSFLACRCDWALHQIRILEKRDKHWRVSKTRTGARGMGNLITPDSHQVFTDRHRDCANGRITAFSETWARAHNTESAKMWQNRQKCFFAVQSGTLK